MKRLLIFTEQASLLHLGVPPQHVLRYFLLYSAGRGAGRRAGEQRSGAPCQCHSPAGSGLHFPLLPHNPSPRSSPGPAVRNLRVTEDTRSVRAAREPALRRERPTGDGELRRGAGAETWKESCGGSRGPGGVWKGASGLGAQGTRMLFGEAEGTCPGGRPR